ncbi:medium-chain fatty acid-CoA ligase faa2 [Coemansia sp. RSA 1807]|nr:medium-chain fatty acid-CoA ligase faa2 [Coemansia sp. RSA 921]KAJ2578000.1 medium-chain fatty acid-CoA ligase faa2 [Coemansia sp. RSA 1807]
MVSHRNSVSQCAIELPGAPEVPGETKPFINHNNSNGRLAAHTPGLNSLYDVYLRGRALAGRNAAVFGYRPTGDGTGSAGPYRWLTWDLFHERFVNLASGFRHLGLEPGDRVGIMLGNSIEWVLTEYATYYQRFISVPIYTSLGLDVLEQIIREAEIKTIVCNSEHARVLLGISSRIPSVESLVVVDSQQPIPQAASVNVRVQSLASLEDAGALHMMDPEKLPVSEDVATIVYTSGTSGMPKGVVVTHANFLACIAAHLTLRDSGDMYRYSTADCSIGFLPLAHCLGRMVVHLIAACGGRTAFPRSDPAKLVEDLKELQPTVFVGVPRLFNRIQEKVLSTVKLKGGLPSALFQYAYNTKKSNLGRGQLGHWLWDRVIFKPLRDKFGGRLNLIVSGSAPISPETLEFLRCCFSCNVVEGYGLSETIGPATVTLVDDIEPGNVGTPLPCNMVKLRSVPDLGYNVTDMPRPRGEILIKGANVATEYYRQPENTKSSFTQDGWLCTGDIGMLDSRGRFHIIDRKNNLFKLAQGEYITPERIENTLMDHFIVNQAFVYGDPLQSCLVAIIVPDETLFPMFLQSKGVISSHASTSLEELCRNEQARKTTIAELALWGKAHDLRGFEIPKNIRLLSTPFENLDMLTPTLKLKRRVAKKHFRDVLAQLYSELA